MLQEALISSLHSLTLRKTSLVNGTAQKEGWHGSIEIFSLPIICYKEGKQTITLWAFFQKMVNWAFHKLLQL